MPSDGLLDFCLVLFPFSPAPLPPGGSSTVAFRLLADSFPDSFALAGEAAAADGPMAARAEGDSPPPKSNGGPRPSEATEVDCSDDCPPRGEAAEADLFENSAASPDFGAMSDVPTFFANRQEEGDKGIWGKRKGGR